MLWLTSKVTARFIPKVTYQGAYLLLFSSEHESTCVSQTVLLIRTTSPPYGPDMRMPSRVASLYGVPKISSIPSRVSPFVSGRKKNTRVPEMIVEPAKKKKNKLPTPVLIIYGETRETANWQIHCTAVVRHMHNSFNRAGKISEQYTHGTPFHAIEKDI